VSATSGVHRKMGLLLNTLQEADLTRYRLHEGMFLGKSSRRSTRVLLGSSSLAYVFEGRFGVSIIALWRLLLVPTSGLAVICVKDERSLTISCTEYITSKKCIYHHGIFRH